MTFGRMGIPCGMRNGIRVAVVADHALFVRELESLLHGRAVVVAATADPADAAELVRQAAPDLVLIDPRLLAAVIEPARAIVAELAEPQRRLLRMIANGSTTNEIAGALHVSERTVKRLTATLLRRLGVGSRTEAAALAGRAGLI